MCVGCESVSRFITVQTVLDSRMCPAPPGGPTEEFCPVHAPAFRFLTVAWYQYFAVWPELDRYRSHSILVDSTIEEIAQFIEVCRLKIVKRL
jgi:hypothetical protein